jgi:hypothetical protein
MPGDAGRVPSAVNTQEASGSTKGTRRARYESAYGSAREVSAALDAAVALGYVERIEAPVAERLCHVVCALRKLARLRSIARRAGLGSRAAGREMGDGRWAMGDGRCGMGDAGWAMRDGRCAMRDGRCAMRDGRWATPAAHGNPATSISARIVAPTP